MINLSKKKKIFVLSYFIDFIKEQENLTDYDKFDIIAWMMFWYTPITRSDRVKAFLNKYGEKIKKFDKDLEKVIFTLLERYEIYSENELTTRLLQMYQFSYMVPIVSKFYKNVPNFFNHLFEKLYEK